jgi:ribose 5-phosphate isomerase A
MSAELKRQAAIAALEEVRDGMVVGLGSGSTAALFIRELGAAHLNVVGIPSSEESRRLAEEVGIRLTNFDDHPTIDVTVDGADEVTRGLELIKGLGGALVREKIVARASTRVVIIVDESKLVERLGTRTALPVEVIPLAAPLVLRDLKNARIREKNGEPFRTDNGNMIIDWKVGPIDDPRALEKQLKLTTGVVDCGIFSNIADCVIIAGASGVEKFGHT